MNAISTANRNIAPSDQVMATLVGRNGILATVNKSNFASLNDVVRFVMALAGRFAGMAQLTVRNRTQGWSVNMALAAPQIAASSRPCHHHSSLPHEGRQYLIPW